MAINLFDIITQSKINMDNNIQDNKKQTKKVNWHDDYIPGINVQTCKMQPPPPAPPPQSHKKKINLCLSAFSRWFQMDISVTHLSHKSFL